MKLDFLNASSEDSYTFKLTDSISNISKTIDNFSVDLTNQFSKDSFAEKINLALRSAQTDSTITGSTQMTSSSTSSIDITDSSKFSNTQFSIFSMMLVLMLRLISDKDYLLLLELKQPA